MAPAAALITCEGFTTVRTRARRAALAWSERLPAYGPGGEPVDWWRTFTSHGVASLPPMAVDEDARTFTVTLAAGGVVRTLVVDDAGVVRAPGRAPGARTRAALLGALRHVLRLDEDLSGFYALVARDPVLSWAARGAGRLIRSPSVFEEVVKTICTTNCTWGATERMVGALVEHLGERGAFPTPQAMAAAGEDFYRGVARAGYRGPYLRALAARVAAGELDLEALADRGLPDDEVERALLALPGVGPYAAAHVMLMLGRYSRLILDSWTRPKYARLTGGRVSDAAIARRFRRYGAFAGLAFWLYLTRDWVAHEQAVSPAGPAGRT